MQITFYMTLRGVLIAYMYIKICRRNTKLYIEYTKIILSNTNINFNSE